MHPGAITLHNYPRFLQDFHRPGGDQIDLAAIDILRLRERGVPRYNDFRRLFHLKPAASFDELTDNPVWARELERVYGDVERVDVMIGMYAEPKPKGFGFSDTAFRVFILMASRRIESDRSSRPTTGPRSTRRPGSTGSRRTRCGPPAPPLPELAPALEGSRTRSRPGRPSAAKPVAKR